ncbi:MAG: hypothetical protein U0800_19575 [Isosphaeraceae bacterium]
MPRFALPRPIGLCAGAFLTLLALALDAPVEARAGGCAHPHVRTAAQADPAGLSAGFDLLAGLLPPASEVPEPALPAAGPAAPGARIRRWPPAPLPPPRLDGTAVDAAEPPPPLPACGFLVADEMPRFSHRGPSIFHPPR